MDQHNVIRLGLVLVCLAAGLAIGVDLLREARSSRARGVGRLVNVSLPVVAVAAFAACWVRVSHG
ncbi:hypothetical protein ND748_15975 [Frankia sp. AiPs1]|uniref:hypothetical protein n=1 Tax=Frankia sp. AiPs1 TaxID=573493 RepID=UPI0020443817|nr:hypothetical protein [Frankia sp. AiPs1]MCM3923154.1 hypothetical protein [Frankia sp. AiPs1]